MVIFSIESWKSNLEIFSLSITIWKHKETTSCQYGKSNIVEILVSKKETNYIYISIDYERIIFILVHRQILNFKSQFLWHDVIFKIF